MYRNLRRLATPAALVALALSASACGGSADCVTPPCALPRAIEITVTNTGGASLTTASIAVTGAVSETGSCQTGKCEVQGPAGSYDLDLSAPGYQMVHQHVVVAGTSPAACGCATVETQHLTVALAATS